MDGGFQFIDIILFAMIAAFLVLRLRSVLGRRDGHEHRGGHADPFARAKPEKGADNVVRLPDQSAPPAGEARSLAEDAGEVSPLAEGVSEIQKHDAGFDPEEMLVGARVAFEMILQAFAAGDKQALKPLLAPEVYANFARAIDERERLGQRLEETLVGIKSSEIVEAYMSGRMAHVTVKFVSEQINAVRGPAGDIVEGDAHAVVEVTDFWTFARNPRARDPNWTLVATRSPE